MIEGTLGANMEANGGPPKIEGYHLYNDTMTRPGSMPFLIRMVDDIEQEWEQTQVKKLILKPMVT